MSLRLPRFAPRALGRAAAIACAALALIASSAPARAEDVDTQQWTLFTVQKDLSKKWRAYFEVQPRFGSNISGVERLLVRPAIGYRVTDKFSIWQGYAWTPLFMPTFRDEHRLFQQFLYEDKYKETSYSDRVRFEERFIQGTSGQTAYRFRNMLRLSHPISKDKRWAAVVYDELFWNLNSVPAGPQAGFDQNRAFVGVSRQVNKELRVETGYMLVNINSPAGVENRRLNNWVTSFNWKL